MCAKGLLWGRLTDSSKSTDSSSVFSQQLWQHRSAPKHIVIGCRFWQSEAQRHAGPTELRFFFPPIMFIFWTYPSTSSVCMCVRTLPSLSKMSQQQQQRRRANSDSTRRGTAVTGVHRQLSSFRGVVQRGQCESSEGATPGVGAAWLPRSSRKRKRRRKDTDVNEKVEIRRALPPWGF